jgi:hypothetical protein
MANEHAVKTVSSEGSHDLNIVPAATSSNTDFDFLHGKWKIRNRKLKERLKGSNEWIEFEAEGECRNILEKNGNIDSFRTTLDGANFEAITIRLFDPKTRLWTIYWADSKAVVLDVGQVGSFEGDVGEFFARDVWEGTSVIVKFHWDKSDEHNPIWSQAFSADDGKTWEWNWYMYFTKVS